MSTSRRRERLAAVGPLSRACRARDWPAVAALLAAWYGVAVTPEWVRKNAKDTPRVYDDGYWRSWWKLRLPLPCRGRMLDENVATAVLHVFFLHIDETPEMLAALRGREPPARVGPTTPGIARCTAVVTPVDRTAARVVGLPQPPEAPT